MTRINPYKLNKCDWYLIMWVIYYLQGILYQEGGIISIALLGIIMLLSVKYAIEVIQYNRKPLYFKGLNILLFMFTLYGFFYVIMSPSIVKYPISGKNIPSYNYLKSIYLSLLPIYAFYYFSQKKYLTIDRLKLWGFIFLISVTLSFFRSQQEALHALMEKGSTADEITNNSGYLFLSCIPLLVLYRKNTLLQFCLLAYILSFIVLGMKRGAIMIGGIVSIYFIIQAIKNTRGKIRFFIIFLSLLLCIGSIYFFLYQMNHSAYLIRRIQDTMEGNSSGRDNLYSFFGSYFLDHASAIHYMFGRGANGTLEVYYNFAHNDWLEIAVNQGLIGIIIFAIYWYYFYKTWKLSKNKDAKTIIGILLIIYFSKTLFSMSYTDMTYVASSVFGFALSKINKT